MRPLRITRRLRLLLLGSVLIALGLAQTLGLLHRIVHAPHLVATAALRGAPASAPTGPETTAAAGVEASGAGAWLKALFAGHDAERGCELYDQLGHVDLAAATPDPTLPAPAADTAATPHAAWHLAAQAAGFLARGPPRAG